MMEPHSANPSVRVSIMPMRSPFEADRGLGLKLLMFVDLQTASLIQQALIKPLQEIDPNHYYYPVENMHLVVKKLHTIHDPPTFNEADIERIHQVCAEVIPRYDAFRFEFCKFDRQATSLSLVGQCDQSFFELSRELDGAFSAAGIRDYIRSYSYERGKFFGLLRLARFVHPPSLAFRDRLIDLSNEIDMKLCVREVALVSGNQVSHHSTRQVHRTYPLKLS
jgi:hypothetical protein